MGDSVLTTRLKKLWNEELRPGILWEKYTTPAQIGTPLSVFDMSTDRFVFVQARWIADEKVGWLGMITKDYTSRTVHTRLSTGDKPVKLPYIRRFFNALEWGITLRPLQVSLNWLLINKGDNRFLKSENGGKRLQGGWPLAGYFIRRSLHTVLSFPITCLESTVRIVTSPIDTFVRPFTRLYNARFVDTPKISNGVFALGIGLQCLRIAAIGVSIACLAGFTIPFIDHGVKLVEQAIMHGHNTAITNAAFTTTTGTHGAHELVIKPAFETAIKAGLLLPLAGTVAAATPTPVRHDMVNLTTRTKKANVQRPANALNLAEETPEATQRKKISVYLADNNLKSFLLSTHAAALAPNHIYFKIDKNSIKLDIAALKEMSDQYKIETLQNIAQKMELLMRAQTNLKSIENVPGLENHKQCFEKFTNDIKELEAEHEKDLIKNEDRFLAEESALEQQLIIEEKTAYEKEGAHSNLKQKQKNELATAEKNKSNNVSQLVDKLNYSITQINEVAKIKDGLSKGNAGEKVTQAAIFFNVLENQKPGFYSGGEKGIYERVLSPKTSVLENFMAKDIESAFKRYNENKNILALIENLATLRAAYHLKALQLIENKKDPEKAKRIQAEKFDEAVYKIIEDAIPNNVAVRALFMGGNDSIYHEQMQEGKANLKDNIQLVNDIALAETLAYGNTEFNDDDMKSKNLENSKNFMKLNENVKIQRESNIHNLEEPMTNTSTATQSNTADQIKEILAKIIAKSAKSNSPIEYAKVDPEFINDNESISLQFHCGEDILNQIDLYNKRILSPVDFIANLGLLQQAYYLQAISINDEKTFSPENFNSMLRGACIQNNLNSAHLLRIIVSDNKNKGSDFMSYTNLIATKGLDAANSKLKEYLVRLDQQNAPADNIKNDPKDKSVIKLEDLHNQTVLSESEKINDALRNIITRYDPSTNENPKDKARREAQMIILQHALNSVTDADEKVYFINAVLSSLHNENRIGGSRLENTIKLECKKAEVNLKKEDANNVIQKFLNIHSDIYHQDNNSLSTKPDANNIIKQLEEIHKEHVNSRYFK